MGSGPILNMARQPRIDLSGYTYHVINRASGRVPIFQNPRDYLQFEETLFEAKEKADVAIFAYCTMPNHFHFMLSPRRDGEIQKFMGWLTKTHTQRWHVSHNTTGYGHLYQGRYKSFIVNTDAYYLALLKYIEQNPLRSKLVSQAQQWRWGSLYIRHYGTNDQKKILSPWIIKEPNNYLQDINIALPQATIDSIHTSVVKGQPFGEKEWKLALIEKLGLGHTMRGVGRPENGS